MSPDEPGPTEAAIRARIREGMTVLGPDGELGRVFAIGERSLALEPVSDAFTGPAEPYRAAAEASPIHQWTGFDPPVVEPPRLPGEEPRAADGTSAGGDEAPAHR